MRIGVLDGQSNPSPITFTDYVQVQAGADSTIRVSPLANDVDPTMGALTLTDVRPDVPATLFDGSENPEFAPAGGPARVGRRRDRRDRGGDGAGHDVVPLRRRVDSGNTGRGLIVVKVVRESVPDYPVVADTVLTAETRDDFPLGVDVLTDRRRGRAATSSDLSCRCGATRQA